jgi:hypothetical protein
MITSAYKYVLITATFILFCYGFYEILCWVWVKRLDLFNEDVFKKYTTMMPSTATNLNIKNQSIDIISALK